MWILRVPSSQSFKESIHKILLNVWELLFKSILMVSFSSKFHPIIFLFYFIFCLHCITAVHFETKINAHSIK